MLETAIRAAREAGKVLLEGSRKPIEVDHKYQRDVKLAMDRKAETAIIGILSEAFPDHEILAEERGRVGGSSDYLWVIDPLDGTYNYSRRFPIWCTSIGLCRGEEYLVGVIYEPIIGDLYAGEKGKGATLNGKPMRVSAVDRLQDAMIAHSAGVEEEDIRESMRVASLLSITASKVRGLGAAATHMAYVASGRLDGFVDCCAKRWDVAAGLVLLKEAGGMVTIRERDGDELDLVASNGLIHDELLKAIDW